MAVNVILTATGGRTFNLKASNYRISLKRYPLQSPLPGKTDGSGTRPVLVIDFFNFHVINSISLFKLLCKSKKPPSGGFFS